MGWGGGGDDERVVVCLDGDSDDVYGNGNGDGYSPQCEEDGGDVVEMEQWGGIGQAAAAIPRERGRRGGAGGRMEMNQQLVGNSSNSKKSDDSVSNTKRNKKKSVASKSPRGLVLGENGAVSEDPPRRKMKRPRTSADKEGVVGRRDRHVLSEKVADMDTDTRKDTRTGSWEDSTRSAGAVASTIATNVVDTNSHHPTCIRIQSDGDKISNGRRQSTRPRPLSMKLIDFDEDMVTYVDSLRKRGPHSCVHHGPKIPRATGPLRGSHKKKEVARRDSHVQRSMGRPSGAARAEVRDKKSPSDPPPLPPINTALDEVYYFSQYVDYLLSQQSSSPEAQDTEDICFLCKDGGDLIECDHLRHKGQLCHCKKVYHEYCLPFTVHEDSVWSCFRHFCGVCGKENCPLRCRLCPNSFCEDCIAVWSENHGHTCYIRSQGTFTPTRTREGESMPSTTKSPGRQGKVPSVDIFCGNCVVMIGRCRERDMWNKSIELGPIVTLRHHEDATCVVGKTGEASGGLSAVSSVDAQVTCSPHNQLNHLLTLNSDSTSVDAMITEAAHPPPSGLVTDPLEVPDR